jgi:L-threonylcarbamoyladenylate synthase
VAFPTETVYGLGASVWKKEAIQKVFEVKGRPADNPLIVHIAEIQETALLSPVLSDPLLSPLYSLLSTHFWPGPLTLIVPKLETVPDNVTGGLPKVAIRMPNHPVALSLITKTGSPLVGPSANTSGKPSPTSAEHVLEDLDGRIAAVVDGGSCTVGIESTVLDITTTPIILRPGAITQQQIEKVLRMPIAHIIPTSEDEPVASPGMKYKHYAPQTPIQIINEEDIEQYAKTEAVLFLTNNFPSQLTQIKHEPLTMNNLYRALRLADQQQLQMIYIVLDDEVQQQAGLMNRILKAAGKE